MVSNYLTELIACYRKAKNRLILLDYDGTLVNFEIIPDNARLSEPLTEILKLIIQKPDTQVFIISGRAHKDIDKLVNHLQINIISDHGSMIKNGNTWGNAIPDNHLWKESVMPLLRQAASDCPESFVEEKRFSLAWHYRKSDPREGIAQSRKLITTLEEFIQPFNLKILDGNKVVEIIPDATGKGKAVEKLIGQNNYDFILSIGDDTTDEEMFEYLLNISNTFTIKVGKGNSFARYNLGGINEVAILLKKLSE